MIKFMVVTTTMVVFTMMRMVTPVLESFLTLYWRVIRLTRVTRVRRVTCTGE